MTRHLLKTFIITVSGIVLCSGLSHANAASAEVTLQPVQNNKASGFAVFSPQSGGLEVTGFLSNLPPGNYRLLIDEEKSCTAPSGIALSTTPIIETDKQGRLKFVSSLPVLTVEQGARTIIGHRAVIQNTVTRHTLACGIVFSR